MIQRTLQGGSAQSVIRLPDSQLQHLLLIQSSSFIVSRPKNLIKKNYSLRGHGMKAADFFNNGQNSLVHAGLQIPFTSRCSSNLTLQLQAPANLFTHIFVLH